MSTTRYRADEYAEIAKHLKDIEAAKLERINTPTVEEPKEAPTVDDVYGMYGYPCGLTVQTIVAADRGECEARFNNVEDLLVWLND